MTDVQRSYLLNLLRAGRATLYALQHAITYTPSGPNLDALIDELGAVRARDADDEGSQREHGRPAQQPLQGLRRAVVLQHRHPCVRQRAADPRDERQQRQRQEPEPRRLLKAH